jgi:hypothetical protein
MRGTGATPVGVWFICLNFPVGFFGGMPLLLGSLGSLIGHVISAIEGMIQQVFDGEKCRRAVVINGAR